MRYKKCAIVYLPARRTPQKRAAAARRIEKERSADSIDDRLDRDDIANRKWVREFRHTTAVDWIRGRQALFRQPNALRMQLLEEWNNKTWLPGSVEYFLDFLWSKGVKVVDHL